MKKILSIIFFLTSYSVLANEDLDQLLYDYVQHHMVEIVEEAKRQDHYFGLEANEIIILGCMGRRTYLGQIAGTCHVQGEMSINAITVYENEYPVLRYSFSLVSMFP